MESTFSIREATARDAGAIARVHVESWRTTYTGIVPDAYLAGLDEGLRAQMWQGFLGKEAVVTVAEDRSGIVGFAHAGPIREAIETCDAELYSIYLLRESQKRGIGVALLRSVAEKLLGQGFKSMAVWVLERNPSRSFYERTGAKLATSKVIEIGGVQLMEVACLWPELGELVSVRGGPETKRG